MKDLQHSGSPIPLPPLLPRFPIEVGAPARRGGRRWRRALAGPCVYAGGGARGPSQAAHTHIQTAGPGRRQTAQNPIGLRLHIRWRRCVRDRSDGHRLILGPRAFAIPGPRSPVFGMRGLAASPPHRGPRPSRVCVGGAHPVDHACGRQPWPRDAVLQPYGLPLRACRRRSTGPPTQDLPPEAGPDRLGSWSCQPSHVVMRKGREWQRARPATKSRRRLDKPVAA